MKEEADETQRNKLPAQLARTPKNRKNVPKRSLLRGEALRLPLRWLSAREVGRAEVVCRYWRDEITETAGIWKEAAVNTNKLAVEAVLASSIGDDLLRRQEGPSPALNFRRLAAGLVRNDDLPAELAPFPEPTLRPEDIFYVLEIDRIEGCQNQEIVAAHCAELWPWDKKHNLNQPRYSASCGINTCPEGVQFMEDDMEKMCISHLARLTLFRRDDGRSICLVPGAEVNNILRDDCVLEPSIAFDRFSTLDYFAENASGCLARRVMRKREMLDMSFDIICGFEPSNVPGHGTLLNDRQPLPSPIPGHGWVRQLTDYVEGRPDQDQMFNYFLSDQDKEDLSCLGCLKFEMAWLSVAPKFFKKALSTFEDNECCNDYFEHQHDLLLILEGLDWK
jgi:hypothetical protein